MKPEPDTPTAAEVLARVRERLQRQGAAVPASHSSAATQGGPSDVAVLRQLLGAVQAAHSQVGVVNPRPPGLVSGLIQGVKRVLRRMLAWYTRPMVEYQSLTNQFLAEATRLLEQQQAQLRGLEERFTRHSEESQLPAPAEGDRKRDKPEPGGL